MVKRRGITSLALMHEIIFLDSKEKTNSPGIFFWFGCYALNNCVCVCLLLLTLCMSVKHQKQNTEFYSLVMGV